MNSTTNRRVVFVTGANRGLGLAIIDVAGRRYPGDTFILAARKVEDGEKAKAELQQLGVEATIDVVHLDVTDDDQISDVVKHVASTYGMLDVLVNNAGIISIVPDTSLLSLRRYTNEMLNVNMTSVACVTSAFLPLLQKARKPRVINITSGLASIERTLTTQMTRYPPYGFSKVGLNGVTAHLQAMENDRVAKLGVRAESEGYVQFYSAAPGLLKTAFTNFLEAGIDPELGAEVVVRLIGDDAGEYKGGSHLECVEGKMSIIPW